EIDVRWGHLNLSPNQDGVIEIAIPEESQWLMPGKPVLPRIIRWIVLPSGYGVSVEWEGQEAKIALNAPLARYENPDFKDMAITFPFTSDSSSLFPPEVVIRGEVGIMAGVRLVPIVINPVQWDEFSKTLTVWDDLRIRIDFVPSYSVNSARESKKRISHRLVQILKPYVLNGDALTGFGEEDFGSYVYVIPNYQGVREAIDPLVNWRTRQGYPTQVIEVSQNASNVEVKRALQSAYDNWDIPPEFITLVGDADFQNASFMIPTWDVGRAYMWETDYKYVLLDGPDLLPEAAIGRISCRSLEELRMLVDRIIRYESDPYMDETDWYLQGAVMANDPRTGYSSYYLQQWARQLMLQSGYTFVDTFYFMHNNPVSGQMFIRNNINRGVAIFHYRGWGQFGGDWAVGDAPRYLRNGRKMPLWLIPTCNSGDFADHILSPHAYTEDLFWASGGGCIGAIGSGGYTHTNYNNVLAGGILNALFRDSLTHIGWALNRGKLELYRQFGLFNDIQDPQVQNLLIWEAHAYQYNLIGDAGSIFWTGVPQRMVVAHLEEIPS
ncbi:MAG: C25 family cysteine peptidase, partial [bacterium]